MTIEDIWIAMSDHFLDTEVRHHAPRTAWTCLRAGLSTGEAQAIWKRDLVPLLTPNLLSVAGEWAGFEENWLFEQLRARAERRVSLLRWWTYPAYARLMRPTWRSIERAMTSLLAIPTDQRKTRMRALEFLCRIALDFAPGEPPASITALRGLIPEALAILEPTLGPGETGIAAHRLGAYAR